SSAGRATGRATARSAGAAAKAGATRVWPDNNANPIARIATAAARPVKIQRSFTLERYPPPDLRRHTPVRRSPEIATLENIVNVAKSRSTQSVYRYPAGELCLICDLR